MMEPLLDPQILKDLREIDKMRMEMGEVSIFPDGDKKELKSVEHPHLHNFVDGTFGSTCMGCGEIKGRVIPLDGADPINHWSHKQTLVLKDDGTYFIKCSCDEETHIQTEADGGHGKV